MANVRTLDEGRNAFSRRQWREAFVSFSKADSHSSLGPADLEQLGNAAYLIGKDDEAIATWTRAYNKFVEQGADAACRGRRRIARQGHGCRNLGAGVADHGRNHLLRCDSDLRARPLSGKSERMVGRALYQQAELHRRSGDFKHADELYRAAGAKGFEPQPGVSLLRLAQGDVKAATASIRRVVNEAQCQPVLGEGVQRFKVLGPFVKIMLAAGELESARAAADELVDISTSLQAPLVKATAAQMTGAVLLARGNPEQALTPLREAWTLWQKLEAPYDSARVRVFIGRACQMLHDGDTAKMHLDAAALVFERLGAAPELARLRASDLPHLHWCSKHGHQSMAQEDT